MSSPNRVPLEQTPVIRDITTTSESHAKSDPWTGDSTIPYSTIQKCPVEVITEIFIRYLEDKGCQIKHLLFVCSHWYHLIIHTPLFWTKITLLSSPTRTAVDQLHYLKIYMQRSRDMLLDIEVDCRYSSISRDAEERNYRSLVELLSHGIHRCKVLQVTLPYGLDFSQIVCALFKGPAPNMVELSIQNFQYRSKQFVSFSELPSLRVLSLDMYSFMDMAHLHHSLPLAGLHSLDVDLFGYIMWVEKNGFSNWAMDVSSLRSLRSLQIRCTLLGGRNPLTDSIKNPISLPLLQNLGLWRVDQPRLDRLHLQFILPSLRTLTFDGACFPKIDPIEVVWRPDGEMNTNMHVIKNLVLGYRSAKIFVIPNRTEGALVGALQMMRREGIILASGVSFIKESKGGGREPMKIDGSIQN